MNIWCISKYASIPRYGAAARLYYLAREFVKSNGQVVLLTSDANHLCQYPSTNDRYNYVKEEGVDICWIKTLKYEKTASIKRVASWFDFEFKLFAMDKNRFNSPDVVIVSSLSLLSIIYGYYLKNKYNAKLVFEIRDIWPLTLIEEGGFSNKHPLSILLGIIEKFGYRKADLIVGTMPRLDLHVEEVLGYKKEVFCSPIGIDHTELDSAERSVPDIEHLFPKNKTIVGYAGSMGISNNLDTYIDTIEHYKYREDVHFVLVGSGDLKSKFMKRLDKNNNVTFVPKIKQSEVQYFLSMCDLLYLSTHDSKVWRYGQSMNKVVQYMLSGKPIIASYNGAHSMIDEASCGVYIPCNDMKELKTALDYFCDKTDEQRSEIGSRGRKWILKNRVYDVLADNYLKEIHKIKGGEHGKKNF
ncbi:glycosyltransferase family 4 protein [Vibrio rotiferianus]|uniref:glycosyltransferase family 4 protein n=1 Tax=Vibrio rotiferianus TaxID=190895 RepID=UPI00148E49FC|nr:glycosyltransferase family 4 protein [Vibrio rotiferianus]NOH65235.1 glycosyltransferase family 4 protein [Vibrio rotiferianus]